MSDKDSNDTIKKIKDSDEMTYGEFQELEKKSREGKLEGDEVKKFEEGMKMVSKIIPGLTPSMKKVLEMTRINSPLGLLSNIQNTPTFLKMIEASKLSKGLINDIKAMEIASIPTVIPPKINQTSKKIEQDISVVKEGLDKMNVNQQKDSKKISTIEAQTKPPSKRKQIITHIIAFILGVSASLIGTYVFQYIQIN